MQCHEFTDVADEFGYAKNQIRGGSVLHAFAVDLQPQGQLVWVGDFIGRDQPRTDGREAVAAFSLVPLAAALELECAFRHVIDQHITRNTRHGFALAHIAGLAADHHTKFNLPIRFQ